MMYDPEIHHRRSIRLKRYDYTRAGWYFVTICVQGHHCLLGDVVEGEVRLSEVGDMVRTTWDELPVHYPGVDIDAMVVMPNHVHGIVMLPPSARQAQPGEPWDGSQRLSLPDVVHRFKSLTTARYRQAAQARARAAVVGGLWQRNYYEHIIRDEDDLLRIRQYIRDNPRRWDVEREYPFGAENLGEPRRRGPPCPPARWRGPPRPPAV